MKSSRIAFLIIGLVACGPSLRDDDGLGGGDDTGSGSGSGSGMEEPKQCHKMDLVFVVDDSGSMQEEQTNLGQNFPMFASLLSAYQTPDGQNIDFRVAVTTTARDINYTIDFAGMQIPFSESGDNGAFKNNCNVPRRWLEPADANMNQALTCRANVGTSGSGMEMPLLMTKWALGDRIMDGTNAGFLRDDALLAVVILTDEDDSSTEQNNFVVSGTTGQAPVDWHPTDTVQFLDALKGHRSRWAAGVIAGPTNCSSSFGDAVQATRLQDFVMQANSSTTQASFSSICDGDLTIGLKNALDLFQAACGVVIF